MEIPASAIVNIQEVLEGRRHAAIQLSPDVGDPPVGAIITGADGQRYEVYELRSRAMGNTGAIVQANIL